MKDYYGILEINENASNEVIEKVHKLLVKKYHPDVQKEEDKKDAEEKMKEINEAYELLLDPIKRKRYDENLREYKIQEIVEQIKSEYNIGENGVSNSNSEVKIYNEDINGEKYLDEEDIRRLARIYYEELCKAYNESNQYYEVPFKQRVKSVTKNIIAILITVLVIFLVIRIPYVKNNIVYLINNNQIAKILLGGLIKKIYE